MDIDLAALRGLERERDISLNIIIPAICCSRHDAGVRRSEEPHTAPDLLQECPEDRSAFGHRQLDESNALLGLSPAQSTSTGSPNVPNPCGIRECRERAAGYRVSTR